MGPVSRRVETAIMRTGENVEVRNITLPKSRSPWGTGVREGEGILTLERSVWMGSSLGMGPVSRRVETSTMRPRLELARSLSLSSGGGGVDSYASIPLINHPCTCRTINVWG